MNDCENYFHSISLYWRVYRIACWPSDASNLHSAPWTNTDRLEQSSFFSETFEKQLHRRCSANTPDDGWRIMDERWRWAAEGSVAALEARFASGDVQVDDDLAPCHLVFVRGKSENAFSANIVYENCYYRKKDGSNMRMEINCRNCRKALERCARRISKFHESGSRAEATRRSNGTNENLLPSRSVTFFRRSYK